MRVLNRNFHSVLLIFFFRNAIIKSFLCCIVIVNNDGVFVCQQIIEIETMRTLIKRIIPNSLQVEWRTWTSFWRAGTQDHTSFTSLLSLCGINNTIVTVLNINTFTRNLSHDFIAFPVSFRIVNLNKCFPSGPAPRRLQLPGECRDGCELKRWRVTRKQSHFWITIDFLLSITRSFYKNNIALVPEQLS